MSTAFTQNYYHLVVATGSRAQLITHDIEQHLYPFMSGVLRQLGCNAIAINGMPDHVHLLFRFPSKLALSDIERHLKARTSKWLNESNTLNRRFEWQEGYGGFTVSQSMVDKVGAYIEKQKTHHAN